MFDSLYRWLDAPYVLDFTAPLTRILRLYVRLLLYMLDLAKSRGAFNRLLSRFKHAFTNEEADVPTGVGYEQVFQTISFWVVTTCLLKD